MNVGKGYAYGKLLQAFETATSAPSELDRRNARKRVKQWKSVLTAMQSGKTAIGSRSPISGKPAWATPEVVRGGFATGHLAAAGELRADELALATEVGVEPSRRALFGWWLTDDGIARLVSLLESQRYRIEVPEHGALPAFAWLLRNGFDDVAFDLLAAIAPHAHELRFWPVEADTPVPETSMLWRQSVAEAQGLLRSRKTPEQLAKMVEALTVWNPFGDELLALWLETVEGDEIAVRSPDGWDQRARQLAAEYETLRWEYERCGKHRNPKENLGILVSATLRAAEGGTLTPRELGMLKHVTESMVAKRGAPGSEQLIMLRTAQAAVARAPSFSSTAIRAARELDRFSPGEGLSAQSITEVVRGAEPSDGSAVPDFVNRTLRRCQVGSLEDLVEEGLVPSAEVLASLTPAITAEALAARFDDEQLRSLYAAEVRAFSSRRSLLLLNYEKQVGLDELPWMAALDGATSTVPPEPRDTLRRLASLTISLFPGTVIPNPMIVQLRQLSQQAGVDVPWTDELAADIFMGGFSPKFLAAAQIAASVLTGSLYERYYGIDFAALGELPVGGTPGSETPFAQLCQNRVDALGTTGSGRTWSPARNGAVIEQAQILTTHNLATVVGKLGAPAGDAGFIGLAAGAREKVIQLTSKLSNDRSSRRQVKDAAYAWRQMLFFLSLESGDLQSGFVARSISENTVERMSSAWAGLDAISRGEFFEPTDDGMVVLDDTGAIVGRQLLGWAFAGRHWMLRDR